MAEAEAYLANETRSQRLVEISNVLLSPPTNDALSVEQIAMKYRGCILFYANTSCRIWRDY